MNAHSLSGLTAIALALVTLGACSAAPTALHVTARDALKGTTKTQGDFNLAHRSAQVAIDGKVVGDAVRVGGIQAREAASGMATGRRTAREVGSGLATGRRMRLAVEPGSPLAVQLEAWFKAVQAGKVERKSISVIFHNDAGEEAMRYTFDKAWPVRWEAPELNARNSGHAIEKIEIAYERFEMK